MDRQTHGTRLFLRGLTLITALAGGCARAPSDALVDPVRTFEALDPTVFEALPSPAAAALLPDGARLLVALGSDGELGLLIVGPDQRILGHLRIAAGSGPRESPGVRVEWEQHSGRVARVEAWSSAGGLCGQTFIGERSAAWRTRHEPDGSLAGEAWSLLRRGPTFAAELAELERARVLEAELAELLPRLSSAAALDARQTCALAERLRFAELALDLGKRAWTRHDRARLPRVGASEDPCPR
ncbi:MAG: hypothetical protein R6X02_35435 [Enhygromyxa sp.]